MILSKYKPYNQPVAVSYLNKVGTTVAAVSDKPETFSGYHFMLLNTDEINAFATPGGFIFITKGLLKLAHMSEQKSDELSKVFVTLLGPLVLVFIVAFVGFMVIAMLLPIFQLNAIVS